MSVEAAGTALLTEDELKTHAERLETAAPLEILEWAVETFAPRLTFATAFGAEGCVLIDLMARHRLRVDFFTLDTGLLFPETYALWRRLEARYGIRVRAVRPDGTVEAQALSHGPNLWARDPDRCCELRKVAPLRSALAGFDAWITAIRREQTLDRAGTRIVERDVRHGLVKVNPLARWTGAEVWRYIRDHDVPVNPLHERGYPSIGCAPCTGPVAPGEDARAGRWRGRAKKECGLHAMPVSRPTPERSASSSRSGQGPEPGRGAEVPGAGAQGWSPAGLEGGQPAPVGSHGTSGNGTSADPNLFPVFLKVAGRRVLVVGGGPMAASKMAPLRSAGARVTVVSPQIVPEMATAGATVHLREFLDSDLDGVWYVIAAATPEVNQVVAAAAERRQVFVNAVDDPSNASAYAGAVLRPAGVTIAISTDGRAPAVAGLLREALEALLPEDIGSWVDTARAARARWVAEGTPMAARRPLLLETLNGLYRQRGTAPAVAPGVEGQP